MIAKGKLVAFDTPENLEKELLAPNEIIITTDADAEQVRSLFAGEPAVTGLSFEESSDYLRAHIKTALPNIYDLSRLVFSAFAGSGLTLLEMNLKKANLEDIFIELAEAPTADAESAEVSAIQETDETEDEEA